RPLGIYRMSVQELKQHPYLDYYQAKEIVRFRERYGAFRTAADLRKVNLMDAETYRRIVPYVSTALPGSDAAADVPPTAPATSVPAADASPSSATPASASPAASIAPPPFFPVSADTSAVSADPP
ncbi:MAG: helix-hairpin-helix domain-containing protein, partial [Bacteroidales bacterium]|nr:helix-hairpin-helix domain-containing protein [Bacteroidales bacterium]